MYRWTQKIHMYAGLLAFTSMIIWGITGVEAVFLPSPGNYHPPEISEVTEEPFEAPGDLDDKALARLAYESIHLPLRGGHYNIHRDQDGNVTFFVFSYNGRRDIHILEAENKVRIEYRRRPLLGFLSSMHASHSGRGPKERAARLWAFYNEFSLYAFVFMTLSGVYLWLATRPRLLWAQLIFGASVVTAAALWLGTQ